MAQAIDELRLMFAQHGLPEQLVSHNGPQFTSGAFKEFTSKNGIKHILVAPNHPASNGAAERAVRVVKESFTKQVLQGNEARSLKHRMANFLLRYRNTPHSTTGVSPAELMVKRQLRMRFSLVRPQIQKEVEKRQFDSPEVQFEVQFDRTRKVEREFDIGDVVRVKNMRAESKLEKWLLGSVSEVFGSRNYMVKIGESFRKVHADHYC